MGRERKGRNREVVPGTFLTKRGKLEHAHLIKACGMSKCRHLLLGEGDMQEFKGGNQLLNQRKKPIGSQCSLQAVGTHGYNRTVPCRMHLSPETGLTDQW